jgi:hypothetical protein
MYLKPSIERDRFEIVIQRNTVSRVLAATFLGSAISEEKKTMYRLEEDNGLRPVGLDFVRVKKYICDAFFQLIPAANSLLTLWVLK